MRTNLWVGMLAILLVAGPSVGWSQRGVINYDDLSQRNTRSTERDKEKKEAAKKAEDAKRKSDEEKKRDERRKQYEDRRNDDKKDDKKDDQKPGKAANASKSGTAVKATGATSKTSDAMKAALAARAKKGDGKAPAKAAGGGTDPTAREVTDVMLDSVRTQLVTFDVEDAQDDPSIIILNAPKFNPKDRVRAGDSGMAQPL